jgi:hypothetical protein
MLVTTAFLIDTELSPEKVRGNLVFGHTVQTSETGVQ